MRYVAIIPTMMKRSNVKSPVRGQDEAEEQEERLLLQPVFEKGCTSEEEQGNQPKGQATSVKEPRSSMSLFSLSITIPSFSVSFLCATLLYSEEHLVPVPSFPPSLLSPYPSSRAHPSPTLLPSCYHLHLLYIPYPNIDSTVSPVQYQHQHLVIYPPSYRTVWDIGSARNSKISYLTAVKRDPAIQTGAHSLPIRLRHASWLPSSVTRAVRVL